jgi:hypothetical protein
METAPLSTFAADLFVGRAALMPRGGYLLDDRIQMLNPEA